ncbi:MAG: YeeE/YedE family protein [Bacteroidia bacterium]|nr:YeeE/YedE family protein [Bacteroidia bacterium]NNC85050.1 YeeE/YedE family protein [Bacteroidia bacterium]NNM15720.1 YeeE/YedE family protein [Bacteroidia bacterium]
MLEFIKQPWPWYVAGPIISLVMFLLIYFGKNFGMSANLRTMCSIAGAGTVSDFFKFDWKGQRWNLMFVLGAITGGFIGGHWLTDSYAVDISAATVASLENIGFSNVGDTYLPNEIFSMSNLSSLPGLLILVGGGFLVGFGARWAGGCTSGHAISGLSDLQIPSLIAVVGFFIGGLAMTYLFIPIIF